MGSSSYKDVAASSKRLRTHVEAATRPKPTPHVLSRVSQHLASGVASSWKPAQSWEGVHPASSPMWAPRAANLSNLVV